MVPASAVSGYLLYHNCLLRLQEEPAPSRIPSLGWLAPPIYSSKRNAGIDGENEREREQVGVVTAGGAVLGAKFGF